MYLGCHVIKICSNQQLSQHGGVMWLFPGIWAEVQKGGAAEEEAACSGLSAIFVHKFLCLHVSIVLKCEHYAVASVSFL